MVSSSALTEVRGCAGLRAFACQTPAFVVQLTQCSFWSWGLPKPDLLG